MWYGALNTTLRPKYGVGEIKADLAELLGNSVDITIFKEKKNKHGTNFTSHFGSEENEQIPKRNPSSEKPKQEGYNLLISKWCRAFCYREGNKQTRRIMIFRECKVAISLSKYLFYPNRGWEKWNGYTSNGNTFIFTCFKTWRNHLINQTFEIPSPHNGNTNNYQSSDKPFVPLSPPTFYRLLFFQLFLGRRRERWRKGTHFSQKPKIHMLFWNIYDRWGKYVCCSIL